MTVLSRNGLPVDPAKDREWRRRSAEKYAAKRRAAVIGGRRSSVKPVSDKRRVEAAIYRKRKAVFLADKRCPCCGVQAVQVHHMQGRVGDLFLDESKWLGVCPDFHRWLTEHPAEAIERGWSLPRIGRAA